MVVTRLRHAFSFIAIASVVLLVPVVNAQSDCDLDQSILLAVDQMQAIGETGCTFDRTVGCY